jgi:hypothetical protein
MDIYYNTSMDSTYARKYSSLICAFTQVANTLAKENLDIFYKVETFLGLTCISPLFECM